MKVTVCYINEYERTTKIAICDNIEAARAHVAEHTAKGFTFKHAFNYVGKIVTL